MMKIKSMPAPMATDPEETGQKRHFETNLLLIHCVNAIWIARIFWINNTDKRVGYDVYFYIPFLVATILISFRWYRYLSQPLLREYKSLDSMRIDVERMTRFLFGSIHYFIHSIPPRKLINDGCYKAIGAGNGVCRVNDYLLLFRYFALSNRYLVLFHLSFVAIGLLNLTLKLDSSILWSFILQQPAVYSVFHLLLSGQTIYSSLIVIFFLFSYLRGL